MILTILKDKMHKWATRFGPWYLRMTKRLLSYLVTLILDHEIRSRRHQREAISIQRIVWSVCPSNLWTIPRVSQTINLRVFPSNHETRGYRTYADSSPGAYPPVSSSTVAPSTLSHPIRLSRSTADFPDFQARPQGPARCGRRVNLSGMTISWPLPGFNAPAISMQVG